MSGVFGGGSKPQIVYVPEPAAPEPVTSEADAKKKLRRGLSKRSTIHTGSLGIENPDQAVATVLGGK